MGVPRSRHVAMAQFRQHIGKRRLRLCQSGRRTGGRGWWANDKRCAAFEFDPRLTIQYLLTDPEGPPLNGDAFG